MANILQVNDSNFSKEILESDQPALVDFWAEWCGPCRAVAPVVEEISKEYAGKLKVAKINVDDSQEMAQKFMVRSIPTFILFKNGKVAGQMVGAAPKDKFVAFLNQHL